MISFFVPGTPKPQGSKRGYVNRHTGQIAIVEAGGQAFADWRGDVKRFAVDTMLGRPPLTGPVGVYLTFRLARPKSHPKTKTTYPVARPDLDKLVRAVFDALTSVCFADDAQITQLIARKRWATDSTPGVYVEVFSADNYGEAAK